MGNSNRRRGDYFERRTQDTLEALGWFVQRAAGSLGAADLVALKAEHPAWMVSCKLNGYLSRPETITLCDAAEKAGAVPILAWRKRPGYVHLARVTRHGKVPLEPLHMPPLGRPQNAQKKAPVDPHQLTIFDALQE